MKMFSKKVRKKLINKIIKSGKKVYEIKLSTGWYDPAELSDATQNMINALNQMLHCRGKYRYVNNYLGLCRRILFDFDVEKGMIRPYVYMIGLARTNDVDDFKLRLKTYINWLTAWALSIKTCANVYIDMDAIAPQDIEAVFNHFFEIETYLSTLTDVDKMYITEAIGSHRMYGTIGDFFKPKCIER